MANEIEYDPAMHYLVAGGTIRARVDNDIWRAAAESDIYEMMDAVFSAAKPVDNDDKPSESSNPPYLLESIQSAGANQARMTLRSNTGLPLYIEIGFDSGLLYIKTVSGNCSYTYTKNVGHINCPCHWAVLRGKYGETCVLMGVDSSFDLTTIDDPAQYAQYAPIPVEMRNNLCKYTTPSFFIAHVMDSLTNTTGYSAVLFPVSPTGNGSSEAYAQDDPYKEFVSYIDVTTSFSGTTEVNEYRTGPSSPTTGWMPKYFMVAGDNTYYARNQGDSAPMDLFTPTAFTYQLTAAFSPMSRCVTCSTLMEVWGGTPIPDDTTGEIHTGPEVIVMGSGAEAKYYLRAGNIFVPVSAPPEDPESEDDNDEEEET